MHEPTFILYVMERVYSSYLKPGITRGHTKTGPCTVAVPSYHIFHFVKIRFPGCYSIYRQIHNSSVAERLR